MQLNPLMKFYSTLVLGPLLLTALLLPPPSEAKTPNIVTTIRPVHSLVAGLIEPVSSPQLLIDQMQSPHHYHLKPSDIKKIEQADIIIYAGPQIETFMQGLLARLRGKQLVALSDIPAMTLHPARSLHEQAHDHQQPELDKHRLDGHLWLSVDNAQVFVNHLLALLLEMDPRHSEGYRRNAAHLLQRLQQLRQSIETRLADVKDEPFIQFHDAFQYFEKEFNMSGGYFFTTGTEHKIGIRQLQQIRQQIKEKDIRCIFYEPPVIPPIMNNLVLQENTRLLPLEPVGQDLPVGADLYFQLMDNIARQLEACLKK